MVDSQVSLEQDVKNITPIKNEYVISDFGILIYPNPSTGLFTIEKPIAVSKHRSISLTKWLTLSLLRIIKGRPVPIACWIEIAACNQMPDCRFSVNQLGHDGTAAHLGGTLVGLLGRGCLVVQLPEEGHFQDMGTASSLLRRNLEH